MAYTPTTWATGDTITSTKLNKMEQGIANAGNIMIATDSSTTLDKTFAEIYNALHDGIPVYLKHITEVDGPGTDYACNVILGSIFMAIKYDTNYRVYARWVREGQVSGDFYCSSPAVITYAANSINGYPEFQRFVFPETVSSLD